MNTTRNQRRTIRLTRVSFLTPVTIVLAVVALGAVTLFTGSLVGCGNFYLRGAVGVPAELEITIPASIRENQSFKVTVIARTKDGDVDRSFNGPVTVSADRGDIRFADAQLSSDGYNVVPVGKPFAVTLEDGVGSDRGLINRLGTHTITADAGGTTESTTLDVFPGEWINHEVVYDDGSNPSEPCVLKIGTEYRMWFLGNGATEITTVESTDGISWSGATTVYTGNSVPGFDDAGISEPSVITNGTDYTMYYEGNGQYILTADSTDGLSFSNYQLTIDFNTEGTYDTAGILAPSVTFSNDIYHAVYTGNDSVTNRILSATSTDGVTWTDYQLEIDIGLIGTEDGANVRSPSILVDGTVGRVFYEIEDSGLTERAIAQTARRNSDEWDQPVVSVEQGNIAADTDNVGSPTVIREPDRLRMWYFGDEFAVNRIIHCEMPFE